MKAIEFTARMQDVGHIDIPQNFRSEVHLNQSVRVLILLDDNNASDNAWASLSQNQFLNGYSEEDAIYDKE